MNLEVREILKPFKILLIILIIEFIIFFSFLTTKYSSYNKNLFEVSLNNQMMKCYYSEKYSDNFLLRASSEGYNSIDNEINEIDLDNDIYLDVDEYEIYYKNKTRKKDNNNWHRNKDLTYIEVNNKITRIQIKRMNKIIYDGNYIENLSQYINEKGRYYIHIYSLRKDSFLSSIKTHISFNVIVGGGNID